MCLLPSVDVVAVSQAPSLKSNPYSPLPVKTMVGLVLEFCLVLAAQRSALSIFTMRRHISPDIKEAGVTACCCRNDNEQTVKTPESESEILVPRFIVRHIGIW